MIWANVCDNCQSPDLRASRVRNIVDWVLYVALVPYRCRVCDRRQRKLRGVMTQRPADWGEDNELDSQDTEE
jgi:hypothetical protein